MKLHVNMVLVIYMGDNTRSRGWFVISSGSCSSILNGMDAIRWMMIDKENRSSWLLFVPPMYYWDIRISIESIDGQSILMYQYDILIII